MAHHLCWGSLPDCSFPTTSGTQDFSKTWLSQEGFHRRDRSQGKDNEELKSQRDWPVSALRRPRQGCQAAHSLTSFQGLQGHGLWSTWVTLGWKKEEIQSPPGVKVRHLSEGIPIHWTQRAPRSLNPDVVPEGTGRSSLLWHSQTFPLWHHREWGP